ncbi:divergent PAP2 family protein [Cohnella zeiphila]|uniref:Divergent PAP2 family protein n=1 Tax=Cohnella zeiphila TaxID=2761120 RepID=A0A7X0STL4_9BACL|nr:divergent PAP2 family protein [Cohnella zeiphila]MBB6733653.1 divergent PAP2 family protein [Cohnella zeiphila]
MSVLLNYPLLAALTAIVAAQFVKVPIFYLAKGRWAPGLAFGTGGMPSSHSAAVASMATAVALRQGFSSPEFAIAAVVCAITMYDAAGIRRQAGMHASAINRMLLAVPELQAGSPERQTLKELLGHRPAEVLIGALLGIAIGFLFDWLA